MKIHVLANDGSPLGVSEQSIHGLDGRMGVGGAELAILTLMRAWHDAGHEVVFYNNPKTANASAFLQLPISLFNKSEDRDILIIFRSPNNRAIGANGKKVWFSCDQYTVGNFRDFAQHVDEVVTISNFHAKHFETHYGITGTHTIDLPVRIWEYGDLHEKQTNSFIFCSVPDRGLSVMADCYDDLYKNIPGMTLTITSDYRLWGTHSPMNEQYIRKFLGKPGVRFLGAVSRTQLIEEQKLAQFHAYSCTYDELFCYASAECQVAGCYPISSNAGALDTTNMGKVIYGNPNSPEWKREFIDTVSKAANNPDITRMAEDISNLARERFSLDRILQKWDKVFCG